MFYKRIFTKQLNRYFLRYLLLAFNKILKFYWIILILLVTPFISDCTHKEKDGPIKILILSGQNNHEWLKTTSVLEKMYKKLPRFEVSVTEKPDTIIYKGLNKFDVLVSNWNNWPDNNMPWDGEQEKAFLQFIQEGGGAVFFHAGASSFYHSTIYHQIGIGSWGAETSHGQPTRGRVTKLNPEHPITKGISEFFIVDEIWEKTDIHPDTEVLASVTATDESDGHRIDEEAVFINRIGKGRSFYTILGHDERALFNTGLQTLLIRGTEWAARGDVTTEVPQDLKTDQKSKVKNYQWIQTDTSLQFLQNTDLVWQYNFRNRFGITYFHPLYLNNNRITCESPADHPWHAGLWFSWKFINEINYWEYIDEFKSETTGYKSEGITDLKEINIRKNPDHSTEMNLKILYYPDSKEPVLEETRYIFISIPDEQGSFYIDYQHIFNAAYGDVILDRTPILGEPDGQSWGGYGGLSIRFNQDFTSPECIPVVEDRQYPQTPWFYMGFNTLTGERAGICMFQHPDFTTRFTRWYYVNDPGIPFFYFSPAAVYDKNIKLTKGESITLKYRVWILEETSKEELTIKYEQYISF